jgi:hypothetical protein
MMNYKLNEHYYKILTILLLLSVNIQIGFTQNVSEVEIDRLISAISLIDSSQKIIETEEAAQIIKMGEDGLIILSDFFADTTITNIKSKCQNKKLVKGEIAIILADRIELMPYYYLTKIQNCLMTFCEDNPNLIEYYLNSIKRDLNSFTKDYKEWLNSEKRKKH